VLRRDSALDLRLAAGGRSGNAGAGALRIGVRQGWQLVQIGSFGGRTAPLNAALGSVIGCALPTSSSLVQHSGPHQLYRIAADQYWIVTTDAAMPATLERAIPADAGSVTDLSHARVRIALEGSAVTALLGKLVAVDLRPRAFAAGSFAQTGLHHVGVLLERTGPDSFEIYALRTYAASTWDWLIDAALPYGYEVFSA
jgi:sarcosine oxidase subunit gamma